MKPTKKGERKAEIPLCVGYSITGEGQMPFPEIVAKYREAIGEVYFSFPGIMGRGVCVCVCVHRCRSVSAYASVWV